MRLHVVITESYTFDLILFYRTCHFHSSCLCVKRKQGQQKANNGGFETKGSGCIQRKWNATGSFLQHFWVEYFNLGKILSVVNLIVVDLHLPRRNLFQSL